MPAATARRRLTDAHRTAQARISAQTVSAMAPLWRILDLKNLDATAGGWTHAALATIHLHRQASALVAAAYLKNLRSLSIPGLYTPPVPPPMNTEAVLTSLFVTGPVALKIKLGNGMAWTQAAEQAFAGSAAAASRQVLSGGRDLLLEALKTDERATGLVRVTSPGACDFCQEIADYSETNPALLGDFQCHDGCHCQPELIYG